MKRLNYERHWQEHVIEREKKMSFNELLDELILVTSLGDFITGREEWMINYYKQKLLERYNNDKSGNSI